VVSPFELEEIFPEKVSEGVSLPRRQAGGSPQGLAVTLIADYTLRERGWMPSAAIVALLEDFGVTSAGARAAISRLARRGVLEGSRRGRQSLYRLTPPVVADLVHGGRSIAGFATPSDPWDETWTLVVFSIPEEESTQRRALRDQLRWRGYAPLYDGLWVSPHPLSRDLEAQLAGVSLGAVTAFRAHHLELKAAIARSPVEAWDIAGVAQNYKTFIRTWSRLLPRIAAGRVSGVAAVRARTEVMESYRRFPVLEPQLPIELLPPDWPRARAREVFVAVYDGLAEPAQEHVRAVVARIADGLDLAIQTHSVADMSAGVIPVD